MDFECDKVVIDGVKVKALVELLLLAVPAGTDADDSGVAVAVVAAAATLSLNGCVLIVSPCVVIVAVLVG